MAPATPFDVQGLNIAYFGRPADPNSLTAWGDAGFSPEQIVLEFVKTSEYKDAVAPFITKDAVDFTGLIDLYYTRLVGRNATISEINGWTEAILSGDVNFDYLGITIANAVLNLPDGTDIKDTLLAKLDSANIFSLELAADPDANAAYSGAEAAEIGVSFLNTVTSPPPATPADAALFIAQLTAETLTLTPGIDTLSGDSGNTTFEAPAEATAFLPIQTLNNGDQLNGGGGRNTLNAQLVDVFTTPTSLANIQEVNLSGASGLVPLLTPATLNVINANAIDTIGFRTPTNLFGGLQVTNLTTALTTVNIADDILGTNLGIQFVGAALDDGDDILDVNLTNAQESILDLDTTAGFYETVNVNSGGFVQNLFELNTNTNQGPNSVFITGNADLDITGFDFDNLRLFDAQPLNANLFAEIEEGSAGGELVELIGSQGNTEFEIDGPGDADLFILTFGGDDDVDVWEFDGNITADLGGGTNRAEIERVGASGDLAGDVAVITGSGDDTFEFDRIAGNVDVEAGDGNNNSDYRRIGGNVTASGGSGLDTFTFFSNLPNGEVAFGDGDSVDGGDGDEDRLRIETGGNTNRDLLVPNVGPNIVGVEIIEHFGDFTGFSDLNVDMSRSGSAFILELRGTYSDDVDVTGLDFESGDVVRLFSDIDDDLDLSNAPLSVGGFRLEMNGVTIGDDLDVGTGTADVVRILSTGTGASNFIEEANDIDARIEVTGDANINIGSVDETGFENKEYNLDGGLIDARGLNAGLRTFLGDGEQTVNDSLGADQIWSIEDGRNDNDTINLSDGADVVGFDGTNSSNLIANQDRITGFVINEDSVGLKVGGAGDFIDLDRTNNLVVGAGDAVSIRDVVSGDIADLTGSSFNFLKFTTAADSDTVDGLFDAAIGAGSLDVVRQADLLGAAYDTGDQAMVLFRIRNVNRSITSNDFAQGIATIEMSYDDFLAFDDIAFVDSYLTTI